MDKDILSKSDPMVVLFIHSAKTNKYEEYGRTEMRKNNLNPIFAEKFYLSYFFDRKQALQFQVFDVDSKNAELQEHDLLGIMSCTLADIVSSGRLEKDLVGTPKIKVKSGRISVSVEELSDSKQVLTLEFHAKIEGYKGLTKPSPVFALYKTDQADKPVLVHRTEAAKSTLSPTWKAFRVPLRMFGITETQMSRPIKIVIFDEARNGKSQVLGEAETDVMELESLFRNGGSLELQCNDVKAKTSTCRKAGLVLLAQHQVTDDPSASFVDFVKAGTQFHCGLAIDFTESNGEPRTPTSLHYMTDDKPSLYARAIQAIGEIIQDYDHDKKYPVFGFGAKIGGQVSHGFFVSLNKSDPYAVGFDGVLAAYRYCLGQVRFAGPTHFAPIINMMASQAAKFRDGSAYFILVLLCDNTCSDMAMTKQAIVNASQLPMSIIFVGIGNDEFAGMEVLDGDHERIAYNGVAAVRDIVQFVDFKKFYKQSVDMKVQQCAFAEEVLAELPAQFMSYMQLNNITPQTVAANVNARRTAMPQAQMAGLNMNSS